ncbi:MAG: Mrp/NBP35 family ATP-binding protein [Euzebyales bacterium]|nr:Mrp/NBP35 family ATP-binding protein [Euzebyales bacterium]MDQ3342874.1 Mrp/NBP35 family ATP-binding protein [Actinomycetota bacterium]
MQALATVNDPDVGRPITELGMVADVRIDGGRVDVHVLLTVPGCPMKDRITNEVTAALRTVEGVTDVNVALSPMSEQQRGEFASKVRGNAAPSTAGGQPVIPFAQMESDTKVIAIASGKGGVGKSSITTNLAVALAQQGHAVGILDADIWGYSIPRMMGASGRPVAFENMVMPLQAHGCKVISIGFFIDAERPVIWRGPMLHRALQQFLADVHWGDLDFLLCDLPPGTGDIAISLAQMLPNADMLVVTTPQQAAQRVALRAGQTTAQTGMKVAGVIENMATFVAPDTGKEYRIFGEGGGILLAEELDTKLLGSIPIDARLREGADAGVPLVLGHPDAPASQRLFEIAGQLTASKRSLIGKALPLKF